VRDDLAAASRAFLSELAARDWHGACYVERATDFHRERESEAAMETYSEPGFTEPDNRLFFYGLLFGAALGAAAGMLLAPRAGAELRHEMTDSARRLRRKAGEMYDEASHVVGDVATRSRRAFEAGREALQTARPSSGRTSSVDSPVS
jgi:gas vesicle protein